MPDDLPATPSAAPHAVSYRQALRVWLRIALLSFGGPAGQIAVMHRILVEEKRWISETRFLHALNYCMLLPGPEAQQLATYIGWLLHRTRGGLTAGLLFIAPGFLAILALSIIYVLWHDAALVQGLFFGLKPAVIAIVLEAVWRVGRRALKNRVMLFIAALAFAALFFFNVPFPLVVLAAGTVGLIGGAMRPQIFDVVRHRAAAGSTDNAVIHDTFEQHTEPTAARFVRVLLLWLGIWLLPLAAVATWFGPDHTLTQIGVLFSKLAVVTFGGAYAVLTYVAQQAVEVHHWLTPEQMLDGLGMAETTPGPLILVLQFVGFLAAHQQPGAHAPLTAAILGAVVSVWVTFAPCFLWIFLGAPYVERARGSRRLSGALSTITAAVVGVIANLALWFTLHTLFATVTAHHLGPLRLLTPDWPTLDLPSLLLAIGAAILLLALRWNMLLVLAATVTAGLAWRVAGGL